MIKPVRIGLVGYGYWGPNYARLIHSHPDLVFAGCSDQNPERVSEFKQKHPDILCTTELAELFEKGQLDALIIATPASTHEEITRKSLDNNLHVLCEKPLSLNQSRCLELQQIANKKSKTLMVDHTFLFDNGIQYLQQALQQKELGTLHYLNAVRTHLGPVRQDVDVLADLASHDIAVFNTLLQSQPLRVSASGKSCLPHAHMDVVFATLHYPQDVMAHLQVSWLSPIKQRNLTLVGSQKMATWNPLTPRTPVNIYPYRTLKNTENVYEPKHEEMYSPTIAPQETLRKVLDNFINAVFNQEQSISDARFAASVAAVLEATQRALKSGSMAEVKQVN